MDETLRNALVDPSYDAVIERACLLHVDAFDWNCPQHVTPHFSVEELRTLGPDGIAALPGAS